MFRLLLTTIALSLPITAAWAGPTVDRSDEVGGLRIEGAGDCPYGHNRVHAETFRAMFKLGGAQSFVREGRGNVVWSDSDGTVYAKGANRLIVRVGQLDESDHSCPDQNYTAYPIELDPGLRISLIREWSSLCYPLPTLLARVVWHRSYTETLTLSDNVHDVPFIIESEMPYESYAQCRDLGRR